MELVSVVIPVYNGASTIAETVNSVISQTHSNLEIVVINDGSKDSTLEIIESIPDARIQVLSYPNAGLSESRNRGIRQSKGRFISFVDADDLWMPDKIELQLKALQDSPQSGLAYSWVDYIDGSSQFIRVGSHFELEGYILEALIKRNFIDNGSNVIIRRNVLDKIGFFDKSLSASEDWDMWLRIAEIYPFVCVPKVQVLYRSHPGTMSSDTTNLARMTLLVTDRFFARNPHLKDKIAAQSYADRYRYLAFKCIESYPSRDNGWMAIELFVQAAIREPNWWIARLNVLAVFLMKATVYMVFPFAFRKVNVKPQALP